MPPVFFLRVPLLGGSPILRPQMQSVARLTEKVWKPCLSEQKQTVEA